MIKAVLFDVDGVLLESLEANTKFYQDFLKAYGYKKPPTEKVHKCYHLTLVDGIRFLTKEKPEDIIKDILEFARKFPYPTELLKMPEHSKDAIKDLHKKFKLGIVTSGVKRGVGIFFEASKLERYFDVVVSFEDYSKPKPDPEPILVALKKLKMKPDKVVYIGDSEVDMIAARAASTKFILYSKKPLKGVSIRVKTFKEIPKAIEKLCLHQISENYAHQEIVERLRRN